MSLLRFFQRRASTREAESQSSAHAARERLQLLLSHERAFIGQSNLVALLREEILAVIAKHLPVERDKVQVKMNSGDTLSTLGIEIEIPALFGCTPAASA